jgi:hypothetical protein
MPTDVPLEPVVEETNNVRHENCFVKSINGTVVFHQQSSIMAFCLGCWLHLLATVAPA